MVQRPLILMTVMFLISPCLSFQAEAAADRCKNPQTQLAMNECAGQSYKQADAELNKQFKRIKGRLSGDAETLKLLVTAQREWLGYRDAECKFSASGSAQGSVYPLIYSQCLDRLTQGRIKELKDYLNCEEGDMSCPVPSSD